MKQITILIILALIATVISIVMGIGSMTRGAAYDDKHSGQLMNARILFQGIACALAPYRFIRGLSRTEAPAPSTEDQKIKRTSSMGWVIYKYSDPLTLTRRG